MKRITIFASLLALLAGGSVSAQDLHKDITVEQEITPSRREAARITVLPTVTLSPVRKATLDYSNTVVTTRVPNSFTTLDPVAWGDKLYTSPYRGYFDFGVGGPLMQGDVSAGYRVLDNDKTRLSLWGQYNGDIYKRAKTTWHDHTASLGVDLHQAVGRKAFIDGGLDYTYGFHDMPAWVCGRFSQSTSRVNAIVSLSARHSGLDYMAQVRYRHFGFYNPHIPDLDMSAPVNPGFDPYNGYEPVRQNLLGVSFGGRLEMSSSSHIGLNVSADFLATGKHYVAGIPFYEEDVTYERSRTTGLITLTPYFETRSSSASLRIGADVDFAVNSGKAVRVAPDVTLAWHGSQIFGIELKAHGGSTLNTLASLYDITPYMNGSVAYRPSHTPYAFDAKVAFGPFFGGTVELFGGYARANDWLMPVVGGIYPAGAVWESVDVKGYHYGVRLGYDNGKNIAVSVSYEGAPSKWGRGYYEWRDRARHVVNGELKVRPVEKMLVTLGYEFRAGRSCYMYGDTPEQLAGMDVYPRGPVSLGAVSNLTFGLGYSATERVTVFVRGENLLGREAMYIGGRPMQCVNGMAGAAIKF